VSEPKEEAGQPRELPMPFIAPVEPFRWEIE